jgi:hypothetical protein
MLITSSFAHLAACQAVFHVLTLSSPVASHKHDKRRKPASIPPIENLAAADNSIT